jgi:large subunit ribosomal protein L17
MRHRNSGRKLSRTAAHRKALWSNLANALIEHERITTTDAKAKELRRVVEKLVTMGKKAAALPKDMAAPARAAAAIAYKRNAYALIRNEDSVARLFGPLAERYQTRHGGYTRIIKAGRRPGDNAPVSIIEFVDRAETAKGE